MERRNRLAASPFYRAFPDHPEAFTPIMYIRSKDRLSLNLPYPCPNHCLFCIQEKDSWYHGLRRGQFDRFKAPRLFADAADGHNLTHALQLAMVEHPDAILSLLDVTDFPRLALENSRENAGLKLFLDTIHVAAKPSTRLAMLTIRDDADKSLTSSWLQYLERHFRLTVFLSFGSLNDRLEGGKIARRIELLERCLDMRLKVFPYFKPLVREWFDPAAARAPLKRILALTDSIAVGGLKLTLPMIDRFILHGVSVPLLEPDAAASALDEELLHDFARLVRMIKPVNIYRHRRCAVNDAWKIDCRTGCPERDYCLKAA